LPTAGEVSVRIYDSKGAYSDAKANVAVDSSVKMENVQNLVNLINT